MGRLKLSAALCVLAPDEKFTQQVTIKSSSQILATKAWTFDGADQRTTFHDSFLTVLDGFAGRGSNPNLELPCCRLFVGLGRSKSGTNQPSNTRSS